VEQITVLLADDNLIVREGVRALLARDPDVDVVGVAGDYDEIVSRAQELRPQVVVAVGADRQVRMRDGLVVSDGVLTFAP
jgi:DNA-binding NarL/FixJ family response regulator